MAESAVMADDIIAQEAPPHYLIWSNEHRLWWRADSCGYTSDINDAGWYTRDEAISICATARDGWRNGFAPPEMPILASDASECFEIRAALIRRIGS
jgi:hypothetical protein